MTPRQLSADLLTTLVSVEGIITKASLVRPKVLVSVHYCPKTQKTVHREYYDAASITKAGRMPTTSVYPRTDEEGNPLETEFGLSSYADHQCITIQEMPESAPLGQLPRSIDVFLDDDLVDKCKPGDRVHIVGVFRALARGGQGGVTNGEYKTVLLANHVMGIGKDVGGLTMTPTDIANIRKVAKV